MGKEVLGQGVWYVAHYATQVVAVACFIAGVVIAFVKLSSSPKGAPEAALDAHNVLGIITCVLVGLQVLVSVFARPAPCSARRPLWARVHRYAAWVIITVGVANCGLGIALWAENGWGEDADWLVGGHRGGTGRLGMVVREGMGMEGGRGGQGRCRVGSSASQVAVSGQHLLQQFARL